MPRNCQCGPSPTGPAPCKRAPFVTANHAGTLPLVMPMWDKSDYHHEDALGTEIPQTRGYAYPQRTLRMHVQASTWSEEGNA